MLGTLFPQHSTVRPKSATPNKAPNSGTNTTWNRYGSGESKESFFVERMMRARGCLNSRTFLSLTMISISTSATLPASPGSTFRYKGNLRSMKGTRLETSQIEMLKRLRLTLWEHLERPTLILTSRADSCGLLLSIFFDYKHPARQHSHDD